VGSYFHAVEFAKRYRADGVVSLSLDPGMLDSDLYRHQSAVFGFFSEGWSFIRLSSARTPSCSLDCPLKSRLRDLAIGASLFLGIVGDVFRHVYLSNPS
jgi:hypothetical protein